MQGSALIHSLAFPSPPPTSTMIAPELRHTRTFLMLQTCQQLPARSWTSPGCQLGCPGPVGERGARAEPLPPINPEQSPSAARELRFISRLPDLAPLPQTFGSGGSGAVAGGNPQGSASAGASPRNLLRVPVEGWDPRGTPGQGARPAVLCPAVRCCLLALTVPPLAAPPVTAGAREPSLGRDPRQAGMPRGRKPAASA